MARKVDPEPRPTDGGSYRLDDATGKWIDLDAAAECVMPEPTEAPPEQ